MTAGWTKKPEQEQDLLPPACTALAASWPALHLLQVSHQQNEPVRINPPKPGFWVGNSHQAPLSPSPP